ncbi:MAG: RusA family crossover junction endodeoxyribonuclease [Actinobacteria bacterium]|nr:RusA family crossover junction endodeoxyribonuclease [Actinomycetota bacterium]
MTTTTTYRLDLPAVELDVFVPGPPAAQGSKRYAGHRRSRKTGKLAPVLLEQSDAVEPWRNTVAKTVRHARGPVPVLDCPVVLELEFVLPRPAGTPKRRTPSATKQHHDLDKLQRAVFDGLTGVALRDDCLIVDVHATKRIAELGEVPGCRIALRRLG